MQREDMTSGIETLAQAYRDTTDVLVMEDREANQRVHDLIQVWWDVLGNDFQFADGHAETFLANDAQVSDYRTTIDQLATAIRHRDSENIELWSEKLLGILGRYLRRVEKSALERAGRFGGSQGPAGAAADQARTERRTVSLVVARLEQMELSHRLRVATRLAEAAAQGAQKAADDARNAAGFASTKELTKQFNQLATRESTSAKRFRLWTIVTIIAAVALSYFLRPADDASTGEALFRIALLAGVLGLATYLGRQAAHHRNLSTWAATIKVQLLTFDGYVDPVREETLRDQMRVAFAARVFGSAPESKDEPSPTLASPVAELVAQIARGGQGGKP